LLAIPNQMDDDFEVDDLDDIEREIDKKKLKEILDSGDEENK
jgi:hypothetical protein